MIFPHGEMRAVVVYVCMHMNKSLNDMSGGFLIKNECFSKEEVLRNLLIKLIFELLL